VSSSTGSFDPIAEVFDRFAELVGGPLEQYLETAFPEHGERALDLGCGSGRHSIMLADRYREVLSVDISEPMLRIARVRRARPNITYEQRDLRDVRAYADGQFNLVFSVNTLHHVPDLEAALRQIRDLVAPGGRVVLVDNVASRPAISRRWFVGEAVRVLALDLVKRRRPVREAFELFRLNTHPRWLDHITTDRFLSRPEFARRYGSVFPGAQYTDLYFARAMRWDASGRAGAGGLAGDQFGGEEQAARGEGAVLDGAEE
jgi:SAM-dependent methyltransferase